MNQDQADKITELESSLMHLQKDYDTLNGVVLENARRIDAMTKKIQQLADQLEESNEPQQPRNAEDEKPPHY